MWPSILLRGEQDVRRADPFASCIQNKTSKVHSVGKQEQHGQDKENSLGQAWVDDWHKISNRARQGLNPERRAVSKHGRTGKARQDYNNIEGSVRVASLGTYAIQYSAEGKRKSMVYVGCVINCVISVISCVSSVHWIMGNVVLGDVQPLVWCMSPCGERETSGGRKRAGTEA